MDVTAESCFQELGPYMGHLQRAILTAPLSPDERAKLAGMLTASLLSVTVDCCRASFGANVEDTLESLFTMFGASIRAVNENQNNNNNKITLNA